MKVLKTINSHKWRYHCKQLIPWKLLFKLKVLYFKISNENKSKLYNAFRICFAEVLRGGRKKSVDINFKKLVINTAFIWGHYFISWLFHFRSFLLLEKIWVIIPNIHAQLSSHVLPIQFYQVGLESIFKFTLLWPCKHFFQAIL